MKVERGGDPRVDIVARRDRRLTGGLQFGHIASGRAFGGERGRGGFDHHPRLDEVAQKLVPRRGPSHPAQHPGVEKVPFGGLAHDGADPTPRLDQSRGTQNLNRLANHGAADAETFPQVHLRRQRSPRGDLAGHDPSRQLRDETIAGVGRTDGSLRLVSRAGGRIFVVQINPPEISSVE